MPPPACWLVRVRLCNASQLGFWNPAAGFQSQLTSQAIPRNLVTSQGRGDSHRMSEHPAVPDTQLVLVQCGYYENYFLAPGGQQVYDGPTTGWLRMPQFSQWSDDGEFKGTDHPARCPPGLCPVLHAWVCRTSCRLWVQVLSVPGMLGPWQLGCLLCLCWAGTHSCSGALSLQLSLLLHSKSENCIS